MPAGCAGDPVRLELEGPRLRLRPREGVRINARLEPGLELPDGRILRFDSPSLTPDSAYFTAPPEAPAPGSRGVTGGVLRASICLAGEPVCRSVTMPVRLFPARESSRR